MSNIFFLYAKNGIILIGDNMVKQGNISDRDLPVVLEIIREVFPHIPQNTTISKEAKLGKSVLKLHMYTMVIIKLINIYILINIIK